MYLSLIRVLKFAFQGFWRNFWLSFITISVLVLIFLTVNFLIVLNLLSNSAVQSIENKVDVSIYFKKNIEEEIVLEAKDFLLSHPQIKTIEYVSRQDALKTFKQLHQNDASILDAIEEVENPLGAILIIKAESVKNYSDIASIIENSKFQDSIEDKNFENNEKFVEKINAISSKINRVGLFVTIFFILIAIIIVFNTIRVGIYTHREEIAIMKLVGANNSFISAPFFIESIFYALFGCLFAILFTYPLLEFVQPYMSNFFDNTSTDILLYFNTNFVKIFGTQLLVMIILSVLSSSIAIRRYLRV